MDDRNSNLKTSSRELEGSVKEPLNREPPVQELISSFITEDGSYDRNHGPVPHIDGNTHRVKVDGAVSKPLSLSMQDLSTSFPQHEVTCVLQCAGNRRHTMRTELKEVDGIDWGDAAVMNCRWRGPRLRDVLMAAGLNDVDDGKSHVAFACYQQETQEDSWYGSSIELDMGMSMDREVILALERNSKPLSAHNGFPVRVICPGIAGARSVKWLDRITVQASESANHYQKRDYKVLPEEVTSHDEAEKYWDKVPAIQDMPINSVIATPESRTTVKADGDGTIEVRGYAVPQGADGPVVKVEVSGDDGKTWTEAELEGERTKFSWVLWRASLKIEKGEKRRVISRAKDKGGNEQTAHPTWNLRGVAYNGYGEAKDLNIVG